jgi:hypothetical protein
MDNAEVFFISMTLGGHLVADPALVSGGDLQVEILPSHRRR